MSKIDDKLEHFTGDIMNDVGEERRQIIEAVDNELTALYDKKEMAYLGQAYEIIQDALISIDQEKNEMLSKTIMNNKVRLLKRRNELIKGMFDEAKDKLRAYTKSDAYMPHLIELIKEAQAGLGQGDLLVTLNASDSALVEEVKKKTGLEVTLESRKVDLIGGCKVYNRTNSTVVDYSFIRKLDDQREDFVFKCHLDVE